MSTWKSDVDELPMNNKEKLYKKMMTAIEYVFEACYYRAKPDCTHCLDICTGCESFYKNKYPKQAIKEIAETLLPIYKTIGDVKYKGFRGDK